MFYNCPMFSKSFKTTVLLIVLIFIFGTASTFADDIHSLTQHGRLKKVKSLLKKNPHLVNSLDSYGWTPLQLAALTGRKKIANLLLQNGAQLDTTDKFGLTPLHLAAISGSNDVFELLVKYGAVKQDKAVSIRFQKKLFQVTEVRPELAHALLKMTDRLAEDFDNNKLKMEPYLFTILNLKQELMEVNLLHSRNTKSPNNKKDLVLSPETAKQLRDVADKLIAKRKETTSPIDIGDTPLHTAAKNGENFRIISILKNTPQLLKSKNAFGITPLHFAAIGGHTEAARILLDSGADLHSKTYSGISPLYGAVSGGQLATCRFLISRGANVNQSTNDNATPLHAATSRGIAEVLVNAGADVEAKNRFGFTPLHIAAHYNFIDVAQFLLSKKADIECKTENGWTPLCEAIYSRNKDMAEFLILKGANVNIKTPVGTTPLKIATNLKYKELIILLRKHGAF
jgi:ankyrin repeat protein